MGTLTHTHTHTCRYLAEAYNDNGEVHSTMTLARAEAETLMDLVGRAERECDDLKVRRCQTHHRCFVFWP